MSSPFTPQERERLMLQHYPLVRTIAGRLVRRLPPSVDVNELIQEGFIGLIEAIDRFDPARSVPFKAYAEIRIRGAMVDKLRDIDHVPRSVRRKFAQIQAAKEALRRELGREPSAEEMATRLEMTAEEYDDYVTDAQIWNIVSINAPVGEDGDQDLQSTIPDEVDGAPELLINFELNDRVKDAIGRLPERQRIVVELYYMRGLSLKEIADNLGVTESRACQLRGAGVDSLKKRLGGVGLTPRDRRPAGMGMGDDSSSEE
jgi:RNA polymerase sigma factor FliA